MYVRAISIRLLRGRSTPAIRAIIPPGYPCRCLCRGFVQRTRTTPSRRIILQFLQIRLIDARTFICAPESSQLTQHEWTAIGDGDGMLEMRRTLSVTRHCRPAIVFDHDLRPTRVDHRLNRE